MNYIIKMMDKSEFKISQETFSKLEKCSGLVYLEEIKGIINLSAVSCILPEELSNKSGNRRLLHDGTYAILKGGLWVMENSPEVRLDTKYFPELRSREEQARYDRVAKEREDSRLMLEEMNKKQLNK